MKKVLCMSFCLILLLNFVGYAATGFIDIENNPYRDEINTLYGLGIIDEKDYNVFAPDVAITRSEVAVAVAKAMNYQGDGKEQSPKLFDDVPADNWAAPYIAFLYSMKIMNGYSNGMFGVDDPVTLDQLRDVVIRMLGLTPMLQIKSPETIAAEEKLLSGLDGVTGNLTRAQAAKLIYNCLFTKILDASTVMNSASAISYKRGGWFLEERLKLVRLNGLVTANSLTRLTKPESMSDGYIEIERTRYKCDVADGDDYLGYYVTAYVDTSVSNPAIRYIVKKPGQYTEEVIDAKDLLGITDVNGSLTVKWNSSGILREKTLGPNSNVVYNKVAVTEMDPRIFDVHMGEIRIVEISGRASTLLIDSYRNMTVGQVVVDKHTIIDKFTREVLDLSDNSRKVKVIKYGTAIELSEISVYEVLSVYESMSGYCLVMVSDDTAEGTVDEIGNDYAVINGVKYTVSYGLDLTGMLSYKGVFYFDYTGKLTSLDRRADTGVQYGYLIKLSGDITGLRKHLSFKILKTDNSVSEFEGTDDVTVNGVKILKSGDNPDLSIFINSDRTPKGQVIKYALNSDGKINKVYTADADGSALKSYMPLLSRKYRKECYGLFSNSRIQFYFTPDTVIFRVPVTYSDKDMDYEVLPYTSLTELGVYNCQPFDASGMGVAWALLIVQTPLLNGYSRIFAVNNTVSAVDADGTRITLLDGLYMGAKARYQIADDTLAVSTGDLLQVAINNNMITAVNKIANTDALPSLVATDDIDTDFATGVIDEFDENIVRILYDGGGYFTCKVSSTTKIYIYNKDTKRFKIGAPADITKNCKMFVKITDGQAMDLVLIE